MQLRSCYILTQSSIYMMNFFIQLLFGATAYTVYYTLHMYSKNPFSSVCKEVFPILPTNGSPFGGRGVISLFGNQQL